jgi:glutamine amidotransferase
MKKITIIDCNIGNRASIRNMLKKLGFASLISNKQQDILSSDLLILPGIGAFDAFMKALSENSLIDIVNEAVLKKKIPILGICLGMQILFERSAEGKLPGLGWISGEVFSLTNLLGEKVKLPHIGWKKVDLTSKSFLPAENQYYFVHSYYCRPDHKQNITGKVLISNQEIVVSVKRDNIYGVQFHPEKSHRYGLEFFKKFIQDVS